MGGFHHVAREARFKAEASGMRSTVVGGRRIVVVARERRVSGNRCGGNRYADPKDRSESRGHSR